MTAVSLIIPARDAEQTLAAALDSVLAQEFSDWEAIIVDDGSRDGTAAIASRYADLDVRIRHLGTAGLGVSGARNHGLHHSTGEALLFLDADDWMTQGHIARLHDALHSDPEIAASYCGYVRVTPLGQAFMPRFTPEVAANPPQAYIHRNALAAHAVLIRRDRVEALGGFDTRLRTCEDWDLWQRLAFADAVFVPVPGLHAVYRLRQGSLSSDVAQLFSDGATIIHNGFRRLAEDFSVNRDVSQEESLSLAYFALWCQAVAAGQRRAPVEGLPALPPIPVPAQEARIVASTLLEALCTGGACTPATFARNWHDTEALLQPLLDRAVAGDAHAGIKRSMAKLLGIKCDAPAELVSVVIPAYRAVDTIDETLCSVRSQTHSALDILAIDDGSADATPDLILAHAAKDPRISLIQQANAGVATARNTGWRAAAADYVAFIDADDLWAPAKIERQLEALRAHGEDAGVAYSWYAKIDADSFIISRSHRPHVEGHVLKAIFGGNFIGNGSAALMTRAALEAAGGFDPSLRERGAQGCEDFSIYFRIAETHRFALVPEQLTGYRDLPGNMSSDMLRMLRSFELVGEEMLSRHPDCRREIARGRANFMAWGAVAAAERGDLSTTLKLTAMLARHSPIRLAALLCWRLPRAMARGIRLRLAGIPRRGRDYTPSKFTIGQIDELHSQ
jgi:glycosyltransferase involved in cell wall biosynthesis